MRTTWRRVVKTKPLIFLLTIILSFTCLTDNSFGYGINTHFYDNFYLRGGPRFRRPNRGYTYLFVNSDRSKLFSFTLGYSNRHSSENVTGRDRFTIRTNYQPTDAFSMSFNVEYANLFDKTQYIDETLFGDDTRYILGRIDKENSFETNLQKLEIIVEKLESGEIGLEESVQLYEEGMKIKKICDKKLKDIEMQIKKIKIEDSKVTKEDF